MTSNFASTLFIVYFDFFIIAFVCTFLLSHGIFCTIFYYYSICSKFLFCITFLIIAVFIFLIINAVFIFLFCTIFHCLQQV